MTLNETIRAEINRLNKECKTLSQTTAKREANAAAMPNTAMTTWQSISYDKTVVSGKEDTIDMLQDIMDSDNPENLMQKEYNQAFRQMNRYSAKYETLSARKDNLSRWGYEDMGEYAAHTDNMKERIRILETLQLLHN